MLRVLRIMCMCVCGHESVKEDAGKGIKQGWLYESFQVASY